MGWFVVLSELFFCFFHFLLYAMKYICGDRWHLFSYGLSLVCDTHASCSHYPFQFGKVVSFTDQVFEGDGLGCFLPWIPFTLNGAVPNDSRIYLVCFWFAEVSLRILVGDEWIDEYGDMSLLFGTHAQEHVIVTR